MMLGRHILAHGDQLPTAPSDVATVLDEPVVAVTVKRMTVNPSLLRG